MNKIISARRDDPAALTVMYGGCARPPARTVVPMETNIASRMIFSLTERVETGTVTKHPL